MDKQSKKPLFITVAVVLIVGGAVAFAKHGSKSTAQMATTAVRTSTAPATANTAATPASTAQPTTATSYKDGTYKTTGSYDSPAGQESIGVSLTLKDGIITDSSVKGQATDDTAQSYQADFISGYKQFVTGKKLDNLSVSRVSGSSLTSQGFNNALKSIESQAKA
jgi:uncharacterized protein with FMN-binding domain